MDSLTQIILGAATGELVLGKKIGNRAMLWGAVGGTIPDLDVLGKFFLFNIDNLAFHRGISHSIFFAVLGAVVFGWLVQQIYKSPYHKWVAVVAKTLAAMLIGFAAHFVFNIFMPGNYVPTIILAVLILSILYWTSKERYFSDSWQAPNASLHNWQWLFFWSIFTHPILDCFTMYGTQLFAPFSNYRVAWSTVSVVDFGYTLPFIICLIIAACYRKEAPKRRYWNYTGLIISSAYLMLTVVNKQRANQVFEQAIVDQNIPAERFITGPTILNNILWSTTIETKNHFYLGQYSFFDEVPVKFSRIDKGHQLLPNLNTDPTVATLRWFSKNYFSVIDLDSAYQFNDLRFGTFRGEGKTKDDYIFKFLLKENQDGSYFMEEAMGGPPKGGASSLFKELIERIKGLKK
jgi:inner membrane protein